MKNNLMNFWGQVIASLLSRLLYIFTYMIMINFALCWYLDKNLKTSFYDWRSWLSAFFLLSVARYLTESKK